MITKKINFIKKYKNILNKKISYKIIKLNGLQSKYVIFKEILIIQQY